MNESRKDCAVVLILQLKKSCFIPARLLKV